MSILCAQKSESIRQCLVVENNEAVNEWFHFNLSVHFLILKEAHQI